MNAPKATPGRERYFRGISGRFIALRGAPFSLSPADLALISAWESAGIPLDIVLEGIEEAFVVRPGRSRAPGKIRALSFCRTSVERAFARHRDRSVGEKRADIGGRTEKKRCAVRAEAEDFLRRAPAAVSALRPEYEEALRVLAAEKPDTEALERLDETIEAALRAAAGPDERREAETTVGRDHPRLRGEAKRAAVEILMVKNIREKFKVPRVSLFYY
ncbi:MAG: hypothetical protein ACYDH3_09310 [Candidatus Aminicenantales bacterium]